MHMQPRDEQIRERCHRGWLRPYLLGLDQLLIGRWDYWLKTATEGCVLDDPIPQIEWLSQGHPDPHKNLKTCVDYCYNRFAREALNIFVEWLLYGFGDPSVKVFPQHVDLALNAKWYKTFCLDLFLQHPYDYLGDFAAELYGSGKRNPTGYFPTPMGLSCLMAKVTLQGCDKTASVCDPCAGSGRLLMVASNYSLNLYGQDIDYAILQICRVNMWMYVPWGIGRPAGIEGFSEQKTLKRDKNNIESPIVRINPEKQQILMDNTQQMRLFDL